jgi:hypothetical protein
MSELETEAVELETAEPAPEPRWFDHLLPQDATERGAHEKVFGKYKDADEALASIPHREKLVGTRVDFPDPALPAEDTEKAHRKILAKLGAKKDAAGYAVDELLKDLDDSAKALIPEGAIARLQEQAAELHLLPWQFERMLARALAEHEAGVRAQHDTRDAAEREMKRIFGHHLTEKMGAAEQAADLIDGDLFGQELAAMGEAERSERGGPLKQLVRDTNDPRLYRLMAFLHDRLYAEGEPVARGRSVAAQDQWTRDYKAYLAENPKRGPDLARRYADERAKERGAA